MAGVFGVSINRDVFKEGFPNQLWLGTYYQQPLGETFCGLSTLIIQDGEKKIDIRTGRGHFRANFEEDSISPTYTAGIGYCGTAREPFRFHSRLGIVSLCFSGNITNRFELIRGFEDKGHVFERGPADDIELMALLTAEGKGDIVAGIKNMAQAIQGSFSLLVITIGGIYAARSPNGHWPLTIGRKDGVVVVASDTGGFFNLNLSMVREVDPGEIILLKNGEFSHVGCTSLREVRPCGFVWYYTASPTSVFEGIPAGLVRMRSGRYLAERDIKNGFIPDIIAPVPDSGKCAAMGYHQGFCHAVNSGKISRVPFYTELPMKFSFAGRSFTPPKQEDRDKEAQMKLLVCLENNFPDDSFLPSLVPLLDLVILELHRKIGKPVVINIVLVDDSIVRGTQTTQNLKPKLDHAAKCLTEALERVWGVKIIVRFHFRISFPALLSYCPWGKTTKKGELLAVKIPGIQEIAKYLQVESIMYNTVEDAERAIGLNKRPCLDCAFLPHE